MTTGHEAEELVRSLSKHAQALAGAASMDLDTGAPTEVDVAVREMLSRSAELVRGASSLGQDGNATALGVVARALLENLILMLWVQVDAAHANHLREAAIAELARMMRVNLRTGKARIRKRGTGEDATEEFLASERFKNLPRRMSVADRAKQAGVEDLYNVFYRSLSMEVHGHSLGPTESVSNLSVMHMQGIGAIASAAGHSGVKWLVHRQRTDNETLRVLLGLDRTL